MYLKTTETCNLNCRHCFTNGINGARVYWQPHQVIDFVQRFRKHQGPDHSIHYEFHGGEPFLVPVEEMQEVYEGIKDLFDNTTFGCTSNLTFKLTPEQIAFIQGPLGNRIGTSWDPDIRFATPKQYDLWRKNVETLQALGVTIKLFISVTTATIKMEPIDLLEWVRELGVKEMALERLTENGTARKHPDIFPNNSLQDSWFLKMHEQIQEHNARDWFDNEFMESVYSKFETNSVNQGTFCRDCEQKLFTLNADGTIAGCPNSAPEQGFGHITESIDAILNNPQRLLNIACETARDPRCYECDVFDVCGSDCHQLSWQGSVCGAPKSLMRSLKTKQRKIWNIQVA
jgi:radical SAM protein with 4Fe4S-binding SPASM domain